MIPVKNSLNLMCASGSNAPHQRSIPLLRSVYRFVAVLLCSSLLPLNAASLEEHRVEDLEYGRSLYQYFQDDELGAITQLMIANERPE